MTQKRFALISVSDKTNIDFLGRKLSELGIEILSTGGTAEKLRKSGVPVTEVSEHTGFPEILDGRVKTLHPKVHGGILADRRKHSHIAEMEENNIPPIEIVVVNLYPFAEAIKKPNCSLETAIENIDIGGPAMIRAAAKNWENICVITETKDYKNFVKKFKESNGKIDRSSRFNFAKKAFAHTAAYDGMISNHLSSLDLDSHQRKFPDNFNIQFIKDQELRYGENPHQQAAFYIDQTYKSGYSQLAGKELSFNNIVDTDTAWECVKGFNSPSCVIVKHANPCGVGIGHTPLVAYEKAYSTDPKSAFGGIIALNSEIDATTAKAISNQFVEVIVAPAFSTAALDVIGEKKNLRILQTSNHRNLNNYDLKKINNGILIQTKDDISEKDLHDKIIIPTKIKPREEDREQLMFAWQVAKFVKSNAIVFFKDGMTIGIGAGQMSRVDSVKIAKIKAKEAGLSLKGSVVASDAFFPFPDAIEFIAETGATSIIHPGGSVRDKEIILTADKLGLGMIFTGFRHFRH